MPTPPMGVQTIFVQIVIYVLYHLITRNTIILHFIQKLAELFVHQILANIQIRYICIIQK